MLYKNVQVKQAACRSRVCYSFRDLCKPVTDATVYQALPTLFRYAASSHQNICQERDLQLVLGGELFMSSTLLASVLDVMVPHLRQNPTKLHHDS